MQNLLLDFVSKYVDLSDEEKETIGSQDIFRSVKKGTILLKEGQFSNNGYFVLQGCLRTYYVIDGVEKTTAFHTEMEIVTPTCVTKKEPSKYFISAVEDTVITESDTNLEEEMLEKFPKFESLCRLISEEMQLKQKLDFDHFKTSSPEQRYRHILEKRPDLLHRVPQHQLASFLGITPQSLSRMRSRIASKKI